MPERDAGSPAQVIYHESTIMREARAEEALENLPWAGSERTPEVPIGRTFGPTHRRRTRAIARIRANSTGLPITRERAPAPRTAPEHSPLDTAQRCDRTDLPTPICAHCLGHDTEED